MLNTNRYPATSFVDIRSVNHNETSYYGLTVRHPCRDTVNIPHNIQEQYPDHSSLINDFQAYLESDDLYICYQPLIDLKTGNVTSVEALTRWHHKLAGPISPDIFIPLAEQTGHIHALTNRVLNHTLQRLYAWRQDGINIDLAVNLSMFNLHDEGFPLQVSRLLDNWSIIPDQLILEITEGVLMYEPKLAISVLEKLHDLGIKLALDDFGAGYSSLSYLASMPISELKIDRSLVVDIDKNSKNAMIVRSTIELAQKLGMKIVAEGVEDMVVCNMLKEYGCDFGQGYFFGKPVDEFKFNSWIMETGRITYN